MNLSPEQRIAGVLTPLFALRTEDDLGIGDLEGLRQFIDWVAAVGFKLVQLLPINETGGDNSPYNAISAMALEPTTLHLAPGAPEDLTRDDYEAVLADFNLKKLRSGAVHYKQVRRLKRALLERAFARFEARGRGDAKAVEAFTAFCANEKSWLSDYAFFRALMEENGGSEAWDRWPEEQRSRERARAWLEGAPAEVPDRFAARAEFFRYVQWIAYQQWAAVKTYGEARGIVLM